MLIPLTADGDPDTGRATVFMGEAQIMTQMGGLPITFEIPAQTLSEAVAGYAEAAQKGLEETVRKLEELREKAAHRILTPGSEGFQVPPQGVGSGSGIVGL